jgi:signal transduction histidine kinase
MVSRRHRPLPAWWPEGRPWPPGTIDLRATPAWWPDGQPWPPPPRARDLPDRDFPVGLAVLFAIVINLIGVSALALTSGAISALGGPYAWPVSVLVLVAATAGAFFLAMRSIGAPLSAVVAAARRVGSGDFSVRIEEQGLPWIRSLAAAFNTMTSGLERQQRERRALMADIAHELRTPVAVIQGRVEGMLDGVYPRDESHVRRVLEQTQMLARLIEDLRTSAHAESGTLSLQKEQTDPAVLVEDVAGAFRGEADAARVRIETRLAQDLPMIEVDPARIRGVLLNLLTNAARHSPAGEVVTIECDRHAAGVAIRVIDRGPGIRDADLARVFDRLYKGPTSTGSGLGLTIARSLVLAHGGTITAANAGDGGTLMTVLLPGQPEAR